MSSQSTISATTVVRGNVGGDGSLEILGRIEGHVTMTGQVIVAPDGVVRGNISATEIQVAGSIAGNLTASDTLIVNTGARVVGDLIGQRIGIAEGALVRGLVRTEGEPPLAKPAPAVATRVAMPAAKTGLAPRAPFPASPARPAPVAMARAAVAAPKPPPAPPPPSTTMHEEPELEDPEDDDESSSMDTNPPPAKHEHSADGPPPPVVPAIKGHVKAKKKFKGR